MLRLGQWKVIYHYLPNLNPAKTQYELFNLTNDPFEKTNVAKDHPQVLKRMMSEMVEQLQTQGALYPVDQQGNELRPQVPQ